MNTPTPPKNFRKLYEEDETENVSSSRPFITPTRKPHAFEHYNATRKAAKEIWSRSETLAIQKALSDKVWRMKNLYVIQDENGRVVPFTLRHEQREFLMNIHHRNFIPKARKLGMSTFLVIYSLDECLFPSQELANLDDEEEMFIGINQDGEEIYEKRKLPKEQQGKRSVRCGIIDLKETDAWEKLAIGKLAWDKGIEHRDLNIRAIWRELHKINPLVSQSKGELRWKNGSVMQAGVGYTGKTPQILHVSELGPIAAQFPKVAENIVRGSLNAVPAGGMVSVETTMEGGRMGECYDLFKLAMKSKQLKELTHLDWKLHFFSWLRHPSYRLRGRKPEYQTTIDYFRELTEKHGALFERLYGWDGGVVPDDRQAWWEKKRAEQKDLMWQQFPSVESEVDRAMVAGQIYPEVTQLRAQGRIKDYNPEPRIPLVIAGDLGAGQNAAFWLIQPTAIDTNILRVSLGEGKGAIGLAALYRRWQAEFPHNDIVQVILPHDANITDKGSTLTYTEGAVKAGIPRELITIVPRTSDIWVGIEEVQNGLPNCWFHVKTDEEIVQRADDGTDKRLPGGLARLENYRKQPTTAKGVEMNEPVHDMCSHAADGLRTFYEAKARFLVRVHGLNKSRRGNNSTQQSDPYDPFADRDRDKKKKAFAKLATSS